MKNLDKYFTEMEAKLKKSEVKLTTIERMLQTLNDDIAKDNKAAKAAESIDVKTGDKFKSKEGNVTYTIDDIYWKDDIAMFLVKYEYRQYKGTAKVQFLKAGRYVVSSSDFKERIIRREYVRVKETIVEDESKTSIPFKVGNEFKNQKGTITYVIDNIYCKDGVTMIVLRYEIVKLTGYMVVSLSEFRKCIIKGTLHSIEETTIEDKPTTVPETPFTFSIGDKFKNKENGNIYTIVNTYLKNNITMLTVNLKTEYGLARFYVSLSVFKEMVVSKEYLRIKETTTEDGTRKQCSIDDVSYLREQFNDFLDYMRYRYGGRKIPQHNYIVDRFLNEFHSC